MSTGVEATTELSDDLLQARSKGKQAANDFVVSRCSSTPTSDFFDPLKKTKLKSFKDLRAVRKVRNKDLVLPLRMDRDVLCSDGTSRTVSSDVVAERVFELVAGALT